MQQAGLPLEGGRNYDQPAGKPFFLTNKTAEHSRAHKQLVKYRLFFVWLTDGSVPFKKITY